MSELGSRHWRVDVGDDYVDVEATHVTVDERGLLHAYNKKTKGGASFWYETVAMFASGSWRHFLLVEDEDDEHVG